MLGTLISGFIAILLGAILIPTIANEIKLAQNSGGNGTTSNVSGAGQLLLGLTIIFFALTVAATGIGVATQALRQAGILGI